MRLHIDVETYSSIDIRTSGAYKYCDSIDFEILMIAFAYDDNPIQVLDLSRGKEIPEHFVQSLLDPNIEKHAHNAVFERLAFKAIGYDVPIEQWKCTLVKSAYCGLPLSLDGVSKALKLGEKGKLSTGRALIKFFSMPINPTKRNGMRCRNFPEHDLEKWEEYKTYCMYDVEAEREISKRLFKYEIPQFEVDNYILDQEINDRGILVDIPFVENCRKIDETHANVLINKLKEITGLDNPNSPKQLKEWLGDAIGEEIKSLAKEFIPQYIEKAGPGPVSDVLTLRSKSSKTSTKKYVSMMNCALDTHRVHGLFQFYGANRTGRWAGRLVQLQNLVRNYLDDLSDVRKTFALDDYETITMMYENISSTLSQLIRTAFIAKENHIFAVADFSAIEARVTAWLAGEQWRIDVFNSHGKIYEASASMMFGVPIEKITKGSDLRDKGKVAELALGYQGAVGALQKMGGEKMGLSEFEMKEITRKWREKSPNIVRLWKHVEGFAIRAIRTRKRHVLTKFKNLAFDCDGQVLTIELPSGRKLFYQEPAIGKNRWDQDCVKYKGMDQVTKKWWWVDSYGGKFVENIVQAISRDILADSMMRIDKAGYNIVMHVHDEAVCEIPEEMAEYTLKTIEHIMGQEISWAKGLPLNADGYLTPFYKKD